MCGKAGALLVGGGDEGVWTVLDGEIFNFVELRGLGHQFHIRSDTEMLVRAYEEHGERFVEPLSGQFALTLWDVRRQRFLLARDRVGIRPLFYASAGGRLLLTSEVKAILAVSPEAASLDEQGLAQVFTFWVTVGQRTVCKGRSLSAGHLLVVEQGVERLERYWDWTFPQGAGRTDLSLDKPGEQLDRIASRNIGRPLGTKSGYGTRPGHVQAA